MEIFQNFSSSRSNRVRKTSHGMMGTETEGGLKLKVGIEVRVVLRMARENLPRRCLHVCTCLRLSPTFPARFQRTPESNFLRLSRLCLLVASYFSSLYAYNFSLLHLDSLFRFICNWRMDVGWNVIGFSGFWIWLRDTRCVLIKFRGNSTVDNLWFSKIFGNIFGKENSLKMFTSLREMTRRNERYLKLYATNCL